MKYIVAIIGFIGLFYSLKGASYLIGQKSDIDFWLGMIIIAAVIWVAIEITLTLIKKIKTRVEQVSFGS